MTKTSPAPEATASETPPRSIPEPSRSTVGCCTLVSGGLVCRAIGESSKPISAAPSGTRRPGKPSRSKH
ncbi:hypothetical protein ACWD48_23325 [Streptomyces sp. NPDC002519]